jgi:hypothetical protein
MEEYRRSETHESLYIIEELLGDTEEGDILFDNITIDI